MKKLFLLFAFVFSLASFNVLSAAPTLQGVGKISDLPSDVKTKADMNTLDPEMVQMQINDFLTLTPKKYKEMTGKKLGLVKSVQLKMAQKMLKKHLNSPNGDSVPKGLYIVLAIFGWAWIVMGIMDDWNGNNWWVNLILVLLCWIPGVIHAFMKMKNYYGGN